MSWSRPWDQLGPFPRQAALGEVVAHLRHLERHGRARCTEADGTALWHACRSKPDTLGPWAGTPTARMCRRRCAGMSACSATSWARSSASPSGQDLLEDVERLRHAAIAARRGGLASEADERADDDIAALVASWPLERADAVARAFTVYFHLANLAEEHQRIRTLRERDTGGEPLRESLAAAVPVLRDKLGPDGLGELLADLRVHPVLTAHPTEARRSAVTETLRRISARLDELDDDRRGASAQAEARRRLHEDVDLLWRTSALRVQAMQPLDEVRTGTTAFDQTLFGVVPAAVPVAGPGPAGRRLRPGAAAGPAVPALRQLDRRRPGRQPVRHRPDHHPDRADPGRARAARAGERGHPDRPRADRARPAATAGFEARGRPGRRPARSSRSSWPS